MVRGDEGTPESGGRAPSPPEADAFSAAVVIGALSEYVFPR